MIITGIAHPPERLRERSCLPSNELVYLANKALKDYRATRLITSLEPGWEQALAKAALELNIPYVVAFPHPGRDAEWKQETRIVYYDLLSRSEEVYQVCDFSCENALQECHYWQADHSDIVLALWDYDFGDETFNVIDYALNKGLEVDNLWQDWISVSSLRKLSPAAYTEAKKKGAQVF